MHRAARRPASRRVAPGLALAFLIAPCAALAGAAPVPLGDLNTTTASPPPDPYEDASLAQFTAAGDHAFFVFNGVDPFRAELWASDGSPAGTRPLAAFCTAGECYRAPQLLASVGDLAFFLADEGPPDFLRLWRSDGTEEGTFPLGSGGNSPYVLRFVLGSQLLYSQCRSDGRCELWASDGSVAGTRRLAPVTPYAPGLPLAGRALFFGADQRGLGLWTTDGSPRRTRLVRRLPPASWVNETAVARRRFFFMAGEYGDELWSSDGTAAGTRFVGRFDPCSERFGCPRRFLATVGERLYLSSLGRLWSSDGTPAGTRPLPAPAGAGAAVVLGRLLLLAGPLAGSGRELLALPLAGGLARPLAGCPQGCPRLASGSPLVAVGARALFFADNPAGRTVLWVSDGTGPGTARVAALAPGRRPRRGALIKAWGERALVALAFDDRSELWATDGTEEGTALLATLGFALRFGDFATTGRHAVFAGYDPLLGVQPWSSDGTPEGSGPLAVLEAQGAGSDPRDFTAVGARVVFRACSGPRQGLWRTSGKAGTTIELLAEPATGCRPERLGRLLPAGGHAFFARADGGAEPGVRQLRRSDGTRQGTVALTDFEDAAAGDPFLLDGDVVFVVQPLLGLGASLWQTDGSPEGTFKRLDFPPELFDLQAIHPVGEEFYFAAQEGFSGIHFFASDGTAGGTRRILDLVPEPVSRIDGSPAFYAPRFTRVGEQVFFALCTPWPGPCGLWRTRGSRETTELLLASPDVVYAERSRFAAWGDRLYFAGPGGLWRSDGSAEGTFLLSEVALDFYGDPVLTAAGDRLYFAAARTAGEAADPHGRELWSSDGTEAGTAPVADLVAGPASSDPRGLVPFGERLLFSAYDPGKGRELWWSDGSEAGTERLTDLAPGGASSTPGELTAVGPRLFFAANDGRTGREPWVLTLPPPGEP